jgi:hypothetical protein
MDPRAACPRCGGAFRCGAKDPEPCACTRIALDAATLARLRETFAAHCLCLDCLRELQREAEAGHAARHDAGQTKDRCNPGGQSPACPTA